MLTIFMENLVSTNESLVIESVCLTEIPPTPRLESRFVSAVQHIPVASKHLAKVWCLIALAGSAYLCCKIYQHFCNKTSSNQHLQGSEWIELNKDVIIEVVEESRLENNLPHNDASRKEHPRIMKIARILVRTSMVGSQLNEDQPRQDLQGLQTENSSLVLPVPMAVDPSDISGNNDTVHPTTSTAISTLEVPVNVDPSDISVSNILMQPITSVSISALEPPVPMTEPSDISVRNDVVPSNTAASILNEIGEPVRLSDVSEGLVCRDRIHIEFPKALDNLQIITKFISGKLRDEEPISAFALYPIELMDIKDDIFSLIRAVLLQNLMCKISLLERVGGARYLVQKFETWQNGRQDWLKSWKFHDAESSSFSCFFHICFTCLGTLHKQEEDINMERKSFLTLANADRVTSTVSKLLEAVKLIMMASAIELFEQQTNLDAVPTFSSLLFSREATRNPRSLMLNHFNLLGRTEECLEEIDYYLLGYSLRETITIIRPHLHGTKDFVKRYPECMIGFWPEIRVFIDQEGRCSIWGK